MSRFYGICSEQSQGRAVTALGDVSAADGLELDGR